MKRLHHPPAPSAPVRGASTRRLATHLLAAVALVASLAATTAAAEPEPTPPDTLAAAVHTSLPDGSVVDAPAYASAADVSLLARACDPEPEPLPAGDYVFAVIDGAGQLRSADSAAARTFTVDSEGRISGTSGDHATTTSACSGSESAFVTVALAPFSIEEVTPSDTLWLRVGTRSSVDACLTTGDPTGFGCEGVARTSRSFAIDPAASPTPVLSPGAGAPEPSTSQGATFPPQGSPGPSTSPTPSASPGTSDGGWNSPIPDAGATGSPDPSPSADPSASADPSTSAVPSATPSVEPSGSGIASPSADGSPAPTPAPTSASNPISATASPGPTEPPAQSPAGSPPPAAAPRATPRSPMATPVPTEPPQHVSVGGGTGGWSNPTVPSYTPFSLPPGYYICPGQVITPTGCAPIDSGGGTGTGGTVQPPSSWSWGPAQSGAPIFPGVNPSGGPIGAPQPSGLPGVAAPFGVEAAVDLFGQPVAPGASLNGGAGVPWPSASWSPSAVASGGASATAGVANGLGAGAATGVVAGATGRGEGASLPPQPAPTAEVVAPSPPALPLVLVLVLLTLLGATVAASLGWARRRLLHRGAAAASAEATLDVPIQPVRPGAAASLRDAVATARGAGVAARGALSAHAAALGQGARRIRATLRRDMGTGSR